MMKSSENEELIIELSEEELAQLDGCSCGCRGGAGQGSGHIN